MLKSGKCGTSLLVCGTTFCWTYSLHFKFLQQKEETELPNKSLTPAFSTLYLKCKPLYNLTSHLCYFFFVGQSDILRFMVEIGRMSNPKILLSSHGCGT